MQISVIDHVPSPGDDVAQRNRERLASTGVKCVHLIGGPGCGKTTLLERTLARLSHEFGVGVLAGDAASTRDAERFAHVCRHVAQVNTETGCLHANHVREGLQYMPLDEISLLFVENVGDLVGPPSRDLGQTVNVVMFSVGEGDEQPAKHPRLVLEADLLLLGKTDLLPHVPFRMHRFENELAGVRQNAPLIEVCALTGAGLVDWMEWLRTLVLAPGSHSEGSSETTTPRFRDRTS